MIVNTVEISPIRELKGHTMGVECIAHNPIKENELISGSHDTTVKIWDISAGTFTNSFEAHTEGVWTCDFSQDGSFFITGSPDKLVKIWDIKKTKSPVRALIGHTNHVYWARYNEANNIIATSGADSLIMIWDVKKGELLKKIQVDNKIAYSVEFSGDGNYFAASDFGGTIYMYDAKTFALIAKSDPIGQSAFAVALDFSDKSRTKNYIFAAYEDNCYRKFLFDKDKKKITLEAVCGEHYDHVRNIKLSSQRGVIGSCCKDGTAKLWNVEDQTYIATLVNSKDNVSSMSFGNGELLSVGSWDQTVKVYKLPEKF